MGLMPIYYTTTKLSGRRKSSVRERRLREEHEKWIRKNVGEPKLKKKEQRLL